MTHVVLVCERWRTLENDGRRHQLGHCLRRELQDRLGRSHRSVGVRPERRLRRDGRVVHSPTSPAVTAFTNGRTRARRGSTSVEGTRQISRVRVHPNPDIFSSERKTASSAQAPRLPDYPRFSRLACRSSLKGSFLINLCVRLSKRRFELAFAK